MSELISGPGKATQQTSPNRPTRGLWRNSLKPASRYGSASIAHLPADIGSIQIYPREHSVPGSVRETVKCSGLPLDRATRRQMEPHLGNLTNVRVHTDARAMASPDAIGAAAYTYKNDVVFASGQYGLDTQKGHDLLAHELVHVAQQRGASEGTVPKIAANDHRLERNARSVLAGNVGLEHAPHAML